VATASNQKPLASSNRSSLVVWAGSCRNIIFKAESPAIAEPISVDKPSFEDYLLQCSAELGFLDAPAKAESNYRINLSAAKTSLEQGHELTALVSRLEDIRELYANGDPSLLFYRANPRSDLIFHVKPFRSAISKIFRQNVIFNRAFPKNNPRGHIDIKDLYQQIDDLLRSRIVCKYLDGPAFVCHHLAETCRSLDIPHKVRDQSTDAGYYAWHFYFQTKVELNINGDIVNASLWNEIQISTQLAEAISSLTHGLYEERRERSGGTPASDWKWDANSKEFRSAYIGHGLHLLEGMIQSFRDDVLIAKREDANALDKSESESLNAESKDNPVD
jgi:hypothetical protein